MKIHRCSQQRHRKNLFVGGSFDASSEKYSVSDPGPSAEHATQTYGCRIWPEMPQATSGRETPFLGLLVRSEGTDSRQLS